MKIITKEPYNKNEIEYSLKKDLLIPCFVYKIPIETSKNKSLNFIEETILKLIKVDDSLRTDVERLSKMLGFHSENPSNDKTKIIRLILTKIRNLRIDEIENENNTEVTVYQFYQEAYTNELLPIITKEINDFSFIEKNKFSDEDSREVLFQKDIQSKKLLSSVLVNGYKQENPTKPTKADIINTIYIHNKNQYQGSHTIDYKNFNIEIFESELIYLHVKLYIPKNNIKSFVITNGFTNDFSTVLRKIFEYKYQNILKSFRQEIKSEQEERRISSINIPFNDKINKYRELKKIIENIEENTVGLQKKEITKDEVKKSKDHLIQSLYDLIEKSFYIFSKDLDADKSLHNKKLLKSLAKDFGFHISEKIHLSIFNVDSRDNLQKHLAKTLVYKKSELYEVASLYPSIFYKFNSLLKLRNGVKHSDKEKTLEKVDETILIEFKELIYKVLSIILKIEQKSVTQNEIENDNDYMQNAYLDLEDEINTDVMCKLPEEIKDNLTSINFYLNSVDFNINKFNIVKEVINSLYSTFEFLIRQNINTLHANEKSMASKDEILKKIRESVEVGESLYRVSQKMIELAFKKQGASLGAYMLLYLYHQKDINVDSVKLIEKIISLRGHGSPNMEDVEKITKENLLSIKDNSFKLVEKLVEEI